MSPIYALTERNGTVRHVDLRRIVHTATDPRTTWTTFYTDAHSLNLHPVSAGPLLAAWLAFHAPREPAPAKAPELPEGWEARLVDGNVLASGPDGSVIIYEAGDLRAWGPVPLAVVEAVIAAHRARGAS